jgi:hypothetical protein
MFGLNQFFRLWEVWWAAGLSWRELAVVSGDNRL